MRNTCGLLRFLTAVLLVLGLPGSTLRAGETVDMSQFLRRAESIGLSTFFLRRLLKKIDVREGHPGGGAEASWGYLRGRITIRKDVLEEGRKRVPFDASLGHLATLFHELTHAANSVMADPKQPRVSSAGAHHAVVEDIRGDVFVEEEKTAFLGLPRYPRVRADEVTGYFMGLALSEVFQDVKTLLSSNLLAPGLVIQAPGDAARLGGVILVSDESVMGQAILRRRYGQVSLAGQTYFQGTPFDWKPERAFLKREMWAKFLALAPPETGAELLARLNSLDNAWIRAERAKIAAARAAFEATLGSEAVRPESQELPNSRDLYGLEPRID